MELLAGLAFGFLGSLHCIGMCGPIVMALPLGGSSGLKLAAGRALYHLGRVSTYAAIGAAAGLFGGAMLLPLLQQRLSIIAGAAVLLSAAAPFVFRKAAGTGLLGPLTSRISARMGPLLRTRTTGTMFLLGLLNGLLPCGFVYVALAAALVTGGVLQGALFMTGFGLGTVPAILAVSVFPGFLPGRARAAFGRVLPAVTAAVGVLLVVRGLNLGIPYISPRIAPPTAEQSTPGCCEGGEEGVRH
jgi:sulfite exporter TauE/SafE